MKKSPKPTGKYAVGTNVFTAAEERDEVLRPGTKRRISARIYYPVFKESIEGMAKTKYMSKDMFMGLKKAFMLPLKYEKVDADGGNTSEAYTDAPWIEGEKFPLIIFNHGYVAFKESNSFLCIELASRGYIILSVSHPLEAACTEYTDGPAVYEDKKVIKKSQSPFFLNLMAQKKLTRDQGSLEKNAKHFDEYQAKFGLFMKGRIGEWQKDIYAALDTAKQRFGEHIDLERIGITGHSFGGAMAYYLCMNDPQFKCGVNIDGGLFGDYIGMIMEKPFMQITSENYEYLVSRGYMDHTAPAYKAVFRDMKHQGFSDLKHAIPMKSIVGKLDADDMHENLCKCHAEFFDAYLKGIKPEPDLVSNDVMRVECYKV